MTETVPLTVLAMYAHGLLTRVATERGSRPTRTSCCLVRRPSLPISKIDAVSVSVLAATSFRPSAVISMGLDLSARVGWHRQSALQISPVPQPVAPPSHVSPRPGSMTPSPHTELAAVNGTGACPPTLRVPVKVAQPSLMSACSWTLALTPLQLPFRKATKSIVPFFRWRSLARLGAQSAPSVTCLFSRRTSSPPGPSSGGPETANRPAVQRGGPGHAPTFGTSAARKLAASASRRSFELVDIGLSFTAYRVAARSVVNQRSMHRSVMQGAQMPTTLDFECATPGAGRRMHRAPRAAPWDGSARPSYPVVTPSG